VIANVRLPHRPRTAYRKSCTKVSIDSLTHVGAAKITQLLTKHNTQNTQRVAAHWMEHRHGICLYQKGVAAMKALLWTTVVAGIIGIAAAQTPAANAASELTGKSASNSSTNSMRPQEFAGTWQGLWRNNRPASHSEKGSKTSLSVTVRVKTGVNGLLSGTVSTGALSARTHRRSESSNPARGSTWLRPAPAFVWSGCADS
jgi:hypothetical protein